MRNVALAGLRLPGDNERLFDVDADALYRESFLRMQFSLLRRADVDLAILGSAIALARNNTSGVICRVADVTDHLSISSEKIKRLLWDLSKGELCFLHGASLNFLFHENRFGHFSTDPSTRRQERSEPSDCKSHLCSDIISRDVANMCTQYQTLSPLLQRPHTLVPLTTKTPTFMM